MNKQKRVLAIHDISGLGKSSLTVALPIISAAGIECAVMPTAVLSTQTSGFDGFTFRDLTSDMQAMAEHWKKENIHFDAIYSGYLGSIEQISIVQNIIEMFRTPETLVLIDPVLGDNGELYRLFSFDHANAMAKLCKSADIIIPNLTEAALMLGREYKGSFLAKSEVEEILNGLSYLCSKKVVLTGVQLGHDDLGVVCFDWESKKIDYIAGDLINGTYYGTGDVFGSFLMGALMRGLNLPQAARLAVDHTCAAIKLTAKEGTNPRMGVRFEPVLVDFGNALNAAFAI